MQKVGRLHYLCRTDQRYFDLWDKQVANEGKQVDPVKAARRERVKIAVARDRRLFGWLHLLRLPDERGIGDTAQRLCLVARQRAARSPKRAADARELLVALLTLYSCRRRTSVDKLNEQYPY